MSGVTAHTGSDSAFPTSTETRSDGEVIAYAQPGLTKREYFAALAMAGLCAHPRAEQFDADMAVKCADALIEALSDENRLGDEK